MSKNTKQQNKLSFSEKIALDILNNYLFTKILDFISYYTPKDTESIFIPDKKYIRYVCFDKESNKYILYNEQQNNKHKSSHSEKYIIYGYYFGLNYIGNSFMANNKFFNLNDKNSSDTCSDYFIDTNDLNPGKIFSYKALDILDLAAKIHDFNYRYSTDKNINSSYFSKFNRCLEINNTVNKNIMNTIDLNYDIKSYTSYYLLKIVSYFTNFISALFMALGNFKYLDIETNSDVSNENKKYYDEIKTIQAVFDTYINATKNSKNPEIFKPYINTINITF